MLELFLSFIVFFIPFTGLALIIPSSFSKNMLIIIQFILNFILFANLYYKKHIIWKDEEYAFVHKLPFSPINNIELLDNEELNISSLNDYTFSTIPTRDFQKKCRNYFYIKSDLCPISHIFTENISQNYENYTRINISNDLYLYYTRNNDHELLYEETISFIYNLNSSSYNFSFTNFYEEHMPTDREIFNAFNNFKIYNQYFLFFHLSLLTFSILYLNIESCNDEKISYFKFINIIIQIIIVILSGYRYIKFKKIKNILLNNIYENISTKNDYLPEKFFNIDSIILGVAITILLIYIILLIFPKKCIIDIEEMGIPDYNLNYLYEEEYKDLKIVYLFAPFILTSIIFITISFINDWEIRKKSNNLFYNWNTSPLRLIKLTTSETYELAIIHYDKGPSSGKQKYYGWKYNNFKIERLKNFDYNKLYQNNKGKICGKDNFGNNLYFPENIDCPINDIIVTNSNLEKNISSDYNKLDLGNIFLYYTNKNIEGQIIIDLKVSYSNLFELDLGNTNELCSQDLLKDDNYKCKSYYKLGGKIPFSKKIDSWYKSKFFNKGENMNYYNKSENTNIYLYSINYLGINSTALPEKNIIDNKKYFEKYNDLAIAKFVFFVLNIVLYPLMVYIYRIDKSGAICTLIFAFILFVVNNLLISFSLYINLNYIDNFLNKINKDFECNKTEFYLDIVLLSCNAIFFFAFFFINIKFSDLCGYQNNRNIRNIRNNRNIRNIRNIRNESNRNSNSNVSQSTDNQNDSDSYKYSNSDLSVELVNKKKPYERISNERSSSYTKDNDKICCMCRNNPIKVILLPCAHRGICEKCYKNRPNDFKKCPFCREDVELEVIPIDQYYKK